MNEKIIVKYMEQLGISPWQVYPQDMAKFAELIVRECASKVTRNEALNILEHFGVEE